MIKYTINKYTHTSIGNNNANYGQGFNKVEHMGLYKRFNSFIPINILIGINGLNVLRFKNKAILGRACNNYSTMENSKNINAAYELKKKINMENITQIITHLNEKHNDGNIDEIELKNKKDIELLKSRLDEKNSLPGYINNENYILDGIDEDLIKEFYKILDNNLDGKYEGIDESQFKDFKHLEEILEIITKFNKIILSFKAGKVYKLIFRWKTTDETTFRDSYNNSKSFFVHSETDLNFLLYKFLTNLNIYLSKYHSSGYIKLDIFTKEWISAGELKTFDKLIERIGKLDVEYKIRHEQKLQLFKQNKKGFFGNELYNKKYNLATNVKGLLYGEKIIEKDMIRYDLRNKFNISTSIETKVELYKTIIMEREYILKVIRNEEHNEVSIYFADLIYIMKRDIDFDVESLLLEKWKDQISNGVDSIIVKRECNISGYSVKFVNNEVERLDLKFKCKKLQSSYSDSGFEDKIGTIDIETYFNDSGDAVPYSIGYKTSEELETCYINDYIDEGSVSSASDEMILGCLTKLFTNKNHNMKLYAHNLSGFDGIIILKSLINTSNKHNYVIKIFSNGDGKLISIDLTKKIKNKKVIKITILDSWLLLPLSLDNLSKVFNTAIKKDIFPYEFVSFKTLNYSGSVPDYTYFDNLQMEEYLLYKNRFKDGIWDLKKETLNYLEKDLISLFNVISEFNKIIFKTFSVNLTRIRTISGLAFLIFTSEYYLESNTPIYFIKGKLEEFIRKAYVGGVVDVVVKHTDYTTYKYDINSHYPNAMLNPMPGGQPRIVSERNLDKIFGFVEAIVEAPKESELKIAILPVKIDEQTVIFRGTVKGVFFSEELKYARSVGYKIHKILSCVEFDKVEGVFDKYVNEIYNLKLEAEQSNNKQKRFLFKLLLNSLYGRLGLKEKSIQLSLVEEKKIDRIRKSEDCEILFKNNNINLVKSFGPLDPEMVRIIKEEGLLVDNNEKFNIANPWGSNRSSVQYCAAITAYARISLNKFKNIKDNPYLGGDTDSIIMTNKIDEKYVGKELGKFKLEHVIIEAFYHSKKFYLIKTDKNEIIIKAKGIKNINNILNYESFKSLFMGENINIIQKQFKKNWNNLSISKVMIEKTISGIEDEEKT